MNTNTIVTVGLMVGLSQTATAVFDFFYLKAKNKLSDGARTASKFRFIAGCLFLLIAFLTALFSKT